jgi:Flp pilus assembly protein TadG
MIRIPALKLHLLGEISDRCNVMKRPFESIFRRFNSDKRGTTAIIYALCVLPLLLLIGFSLDGARMTTAKTHMQSSMDAAVLAGAREYLSNASASEADRKAAARNAVISFFNEDVSTANNQLGSPNITVTVSEMGEVVATAESNLPLLFGGLFGRESVDLNVNGAAQSGDSRRVEVILALDNTSSMFEQGRFTKMREASKGFVDTMFEQTPAEGLMSIGVVPWASVVNINSETPNGWAPGAGSGGTPPVYGTAKTPNSPFENRRKYLYEPEAETAYTSSAMAADFAPVDWRGCIRSAPNERRVSAGGIVTSRLTDDSVAGMRWHASLLEPELQSWWVPPADWTPSTNPGPTTPPKPKPPTPGPQGFLNPGYLSDIQTAGLTVPADRRLRCTPTSWQGGYEGSRNIYLNETQQCAEKFQDEFNGIAKACVSDPTEFAYFNAGKKACEWQKDIFPWDSYKAVSGPNMNCPTAMLGLSGDKGQIMDKLNHMYPVQGGTQADIGLMWGLRALSPRSQWTSFFDHTGAKAPKAFNDPGVRKIMILLTDGKNEAPYHYEGYYGCNEDSNRGEAGECWKAKGVKDLGRSSLDGLTLDSCEAIREDYGIELYTIAVDITDGDAISLLGTCANDPNRTFNITAAELDKTFDTIAARELRLTK